MSLILYLLFCLIVWMVDLGKRERVRHCQWSKGNYGCRNYIGWIFLGGTKRQGKECMKEVKEIMGVGIRMGGQRGGVTCNQWGLMMRRLWCEGDWIGSNIILTVCQKWRFGGRLKGELGIEGARKRIWRYANCASTMWFYRRGRRMKWNNMNCKGLSYSSSAVKDVSDQRIFVVREHGRLAFWWAWVSNAWG